MDHVLSGRVGIGFTQDVTGNRMARGEWSLGFASASTLLSHDNNDLGTRKWSGKLVFPIPLLQNVKVELGQVFHIKYFIFKLLTKGE